MNTAARRDHGSFIGKIAAATVTGAYVVLLCQGMVIEMLLSYDSGGAQYSLLEMIMNIFWSENTFTPLMFIFTLMAFYDQKRRSGTENRASVFLQALLPAGFIVLIAAICFMITIGTVNYQVGSWSVGVVQAANNSKWDWLVAQIDFARITANPFAYVLCFTFVPLLLYCWMLMLIIKLWADREKSETGLSICLSIQICGMCLFRSALPMMIKNFTPQALVLYPQHRLTSGDGANVTPEAATVFLAAVLIALLYWWARRKKNVQKNT
ncbi:MAG: hypothetical protein DBX46_03010 [Clostridiales bacterium]|nr:MAG: hypothetical protein DBX46_03010 [Clostridiales bacterium]